MAGNRIHASKFANISTGVVQVRPGTLVLAPGSCIPSDGGEVHPALSSPQFLQSVIAKLGLDSRWGLGPADSFARLRSMIRYGTIEGTSLTEISVHGQDIGESTAICREVLEEFKQSLARETSEQRALRLAWAKEAALHQEDFVNRKRAELSNLLRWDRHGRFPAEKAAFDEAQRELQELKIHEITLILENKVLEEPVLIHAWPSATDPVSMRSEWIRSLLLHLVPGLIGGTLAAIASIYLLEFLLPRRNAPPPA